MKKQHFLRRMPAVAAAALTACVLLITGCGAARESSGSGTAAAEAEEKEETAGAAESSGASSAAGESTSGAADLSGSASALGKLSSFSADTLAGGTFTDEDLSGKDATIFNFWSVTCGPCIREMPDIAAFEKALPENVQLVTVCLDGASGKEEAESILQEAGFEGTTLISGSGDLLSVVQNLQFTPTTVIADGAGNLRGDALIGASDDLFGTWQDAVNSVLKADGKEEITVHEN